MIHSILVSHCSLLLLLRGFARILLGFQNLLQIRFLQTLLDFLGCLWPCFHDLFCLLPLLSLLFLLLVPFVFFCILLFLLGFSHFLLHSLVLFLNSLFDYLYYPFRLSIYFLMLFYLVFPLPFFLFLFLSMVLLKE